MSKDIPFDYGINTPSIEHMERLQDTVSELAEMLLKFVNHPPETYDYIYAFCFYCDADLHFGDPHHDDCIWVMAKNLITVEGKS